MFAEERLEEILNILSETGRIKVKELSEKFNVSEGMIRKDLQKLEKTHSIQRTYGGAILNRKIATNTSISTRIHVNLSSKELIANKALDIIEDGDIIFLDASSINFLLAKLLSSSNKKITLVTNMPLIFPLFNNNETVDVICIGGIYDKKSGGLLGTEVTKSINKYNFNKGFIGSSGVNLIANSISTITLEDGNIKEAVIYHSKKTFLLVEKEKFNIDGTYIFASLDDLYSIITDCDIDEDIKELLNESSIQVL